MYRLLDSGNQKKLEQFGSRVVMRPAAVALWSPSRNTWKWDLSFQRSPNRWEGNPSPWTMSYMGLEWELMGNDFGHVGIFPEHAVLWEYLRKECQKRPVKLLNLFAYNGGATLIAAQQGASVTHVDASKKSVTWAKRLASLNHLEHAPIRWIVDDVMQFLKREVRRNNQYDGILCDPPSFGQGTEKQIFKLEYHLVSLVKLCAELLKRPGFFILSSHTPGITQTVLQQLVEPLFPGARGGELSLKGEGHLLPSGYYIVWEGS